MSVVFILYIFLQITVFSPFLHDEVYNFVKEQKHDAQTNKTARLSFVYQCNSLPNCIY